MGICICVLYTELNSYLLKVMEEGISAKAVTDKSYVLNVGSGMELTGHVIGTSSILEWIDKS